MKWLVCLLILVAAAISACAPPRSEPAITPTNQLPAVTPTTPPAEKPVLTSTPALSPTPTLTVTPTPATPTPTTAAPVKLPNLIPVDIAIETNSDDYLKSNVVLTFKNFGEGDASEFDFKLAGSYLKNKDVDLWKSSSSALSAGKSTSVKVTLEKIVEGTMTLSVPFLPGNVSFALFADPSNKIKESNKEDNTFSKKLVVAKPPYNPGELSTEIKKIEEMVTMLRSFSTR